MQAPSLDRTIVEQQLAREQLHQDATKRPHVDLWAVSESQHHFWRSVGSRLHIRAALVVVQVRVAVINHLNLAFRERGDQDILRFLRSNGKASKWGGEASRGSGSERGAPDRSG